MATRTITEAARTAGGDGPQLRTCRRWRGGPGRAVGIACWLLLAAGCAGESAPDSAGRSAAGGMASAVSLTCDPDNDTPDVLNHYAARFEADPDRWKFLTGDMEVIKRVGMETFKLPVEVGVHSERGVVFDRQGRMRGSYHLLQEDRVQRLKKLIRDVLAEEQP